ncbi:Uncharacterized conserved protein [Janthinobacterium sp. Marseille]|nr:DUF2950 domain-containing protein [Janthinobacterium sp. Marseille]ABR91245.1 Uncharacterized conserved protein [Janthinobacterium sp. Marseille]
MNKIMNPSFSVPAVTGRHNLRALLLAAAFTFSSTAALAQQSYPSADDAANAFADAVTRQDTGQLNKVLGKDWKTLMPTQNIAQQDIDDFLAAWKQAHRVVAQGADRAVVEVGTQGWTLPMPVVKRGTGWQFDVQAGSEEMRTRRIGRNELNTMQALLAYYDAQKEYASVDRGNDGVLQYAQKFKSTAGKHDGLYWAVSGKEAESPLGSLFAEIKPGEGYHGYYYRILTAQGENANGGAYSYIIKGRMVSGFALLAWPINYGQTGVKSFIISHDGKVYEKDFGPNTPALVKRIKVFDPDKSWQKVALPEPVSQSASNASNKAP